MPMADPFEIEVDRVRQEHPDWKPERIARHLRQPAERVRKLLLQQAEWEKHAEAQSDG
jgi:hypothetical protein